MNQMSAASGQDAARMAGLLAEDYELVYVAQDYATGEWCVFYSLPKKTPTTKGAK